MAWAGPKLQLMSAVYAQLNIQTCVLVRSEEKWLCKNLQPSTIICNFSTVGESQKCSQMWSPLNNLSTDLAWRIILFTLFFVVSAIFRTDESGSHMLVVLTAQQQPVSWHPERSCFCRISGVAGCAADSVKSSKNYTTYYYTIVKDASCLKGLKLIPSSFSVFFCFSKSCHARGQK